MPGGILGKCWRDSVGDAGRMLERYWGEAGGMLRKTGAGLGDTGWAGKEKMGERWGDTGKYCGILGGWGEAGEGFWGEDGEMLAGKVGED